MHWFRVYDAIIDDPKIQRLPVEVRWFYLEILCVANRQTPRGSLPLAVDIAFLLRSDEATIKRNLKAILDAGLIEKGDVTLWRVHSWEARQQKSDNAAERMRAYRRGGTDGEQSAEHVRNKKANMFGTCSVPNRVEKSRGEKLPLTPSSEGGEKSAPKRERKPDLPEHVPLLEQAAAWWGIRSGPPVVRRLLRSYKLPSVERAMAELRRIAGEEPFDRRRLEGICRSIDCGLWGNAPTIAAHSRAPEPPAPPLVFTRAPIGWDKPPARSADAS